MRALAVLLLASTALFADDGRQILRDAEARHRSRTQEYEGVLTVTSKDGKVRRKSWKSYRDGYAGDARQLIRFTDPPEVRGVGFLSVGKKGKSPDQWLYLPSMKRERRIAAQDREASFVGTDFSYEDLDELDESAFEVSEEKSEAEGGQDCHVLELRPKERSQYERKRVFVRKSDLYVARVDSFRKGQKEPYKRFLALDIATVAGHVAARRLEMRDLVKGSTTVVLLEKLSFDVAQPADRFTLQNLNREGGD